ncbi:putative manganese transporter [Catenisphaera adipataccumulans]|jgi:hypothetical protein|uniref:Arsenic efflux protein n=1 Tax=Catenisphaera adipataccumulans TaxID=700500 RepID=A0A7W8CZ35_9FIRM|nr:putative manganese transporter [Catenisphaera adipataccumulans]MBB5183674.1 hypothetical protein [Catenisphaera adipataccumulans]
MNILLDSFHDTWTMFPLLIVTYVIIEHFERRQNAKTDDKIFVGLQKFGPLIGALVGLLPQCGFSVLAAMLFVQRSITMGTLLAVMISTSDEAIPILLSNPSMYTTLGWVLIMKFILGISVGYLIDFLLRKRQHIIRFEDMPEENGEEYDEFDDYEGSAMQCPCCYTDKPMAVSVLLRSAKIWIFLFVTTLILTAIIQTFGEQALRTILLSNTVFQPVLAAVIGLIPNCAATVILAQLYATGSISSGSLLSGLITNSGLGMLVLIRYGERRRNILRIITILLITAILSGIIIQALA